MQVRAMREALENAARAVSHAQGEASELRQALLGERQSHAEVQRHYLELQQHHKVTTMKDIAGLARENRRLRSMLAEASAGSGSSTESVRKIGPRRASEISAIEDLPAVMFAS